MMSIYFLIFPWLVHHGLACVALNSLEAASTQLHSSNNTSNVTKWYFNKEKLDILDKVLQ